MKTIRVFWLIAMLAFCMQGVDARVYRWIDEKGNVQFSDKPPPDGVKGAAELDAQGMVRKTPEKAASAGEIAAREAERLKALEQRRRDSALLQSFSRPEDIDQLRNRRIDAVNARMQTNKLRKQAVDAKLTRLNTQFVALGKAGKKIPDSLSVDIDATRKELAALDIEAKKMEEEIVAIRERAEADKKRLLELQGQSKH